MSAPNGHRIPIPSDSIRGNTRQTNSPSTTNGVQSPFSTSSNGADVPQNTSISGNSPHAGSPQTHNTPQRDDNSTRNSPRVADPNDGKVIGYSDPNCDIEDELVEIRMRNGDLVWSTGTLAKRLRDQQGGAWSCEMAFRVTFQSVTSNEIDSLAPIAWFD